MSSQMILFVYPPIRQSFKTLKTEDFVFVVYAVEKGWEENASYNFTSKR